MVNNKKKSTNYHLKLWLLSAVSQLLLLPTIFLLPSFLVMAVLMSKSKSTLNIIVLILAFDFLIYCIVALFILTRKSLHIKDRLMIFFIPMFTFIFLFYSFNFLTEKFSLLRKNQDNQLIINHLTVSKNVQYSTHVATNEKIVLEVLIPVTLSSDFYSKQIPELFSINISGIITQENRISKPYIINLNSEQCEIEESNRVLIKDSNNRIYNLENYIPDDKGTKLTSGNYYFDKEYFITGSQQCVEAFKENIARKELNIYKIIKILNDGTVKKELYSTFTINNN